MESVPKLSLLIELNGRLIEDEVCDDFDTCLNNKYIDNCPLKLTGLALDQMSITRGRSMIFSNPDFRKELSNRKLFQIEKKQSTKELSLMRAEDNNQTEPERKTSKRKRITRCSNGRCTSVKPPGKLPKNSIWTKCKGCDGIYCADSSCIDILKSHEMI